MPETLRLLSETLVFAGRPAAGFTYAGMTCKLWRMDRSASERPPLQLVHASDRPARVPAADELVQKAQELMRADLRLRWTVTSLARRVGLSRPAFARRFLKTTGRSPMKYLAHERMQRAAELLSESGWSLAQIGVAVGYESEFAFNRAFKRWHQIAPGAFRRASRSTTPTLRAAA